MRRAMPAPPLVVHLIYRLAMGGMETLLVERIKRMPVERYRHAVVCLDDYDAAFARALRQPGAAVYALHKKPGLSCATHLHLWRLLRRLRPQVFHSYNLSAVEYGVTAWLARVPVRISGAHGRDGADLAGTSRKHNLLRRLMLPFYDCSYANSAAMLEWYRDVIGVSAARSRLLANGVDTEKFHAADAATAPGARPVAAAAAAAASAAAALSAAPFGPACIVIATVGRVQQVKDHAGLLRAFLLLRQRLPALVPLLRLAVLGDGPLLADLRAMAAAAGVGDVVWLPGARDDVAELLRGFSIFALASLAEGTPGAALEAMASGLPVVATRVGGMPEVVDDGVTGYLVPAADSAAMAVALARYALDPALAASHGAAARRRVLQYYGMAAMVAGYQALYDQLCGQKITARKAAKSCAE